MMKFSRLVYKVLAWLFTAGVVIQVFLAGMVIVARQMEWEPHIGLGHLLAVPVLFMLVSMYTGRLPGTLKRLTWLLFLFYALQADVVIFLRVQAPVISALHPVLALADFSLGLTLALRAGKLASEEAQPAVKPL